RMGFKSDLLMQGGATRVRRSLQPSQSTVSNETIRLRNAVHWSEQFILGHFRWYVLVILAVFVFLLVATVIITCYFDCQNRRTRLPRASRHGRPVLTTSQASSHPLLSDDSTQESAPTPVERGSLKHRLMIEAHQSVSETSKSLTETNQSCFILPFHRFDLRGFRIGCFSS
uniref:Major facilitator superfamily (MFS) profile domain-containing protein n=1 Tax=Parascaris univalens TaxID=6257 RepID=A0A914ZYM7_PARUN